MSSSHVIKVQDLRKTYDIYDSPADRLKHYLWGKNKQDHKTFTALNNVSFEVNRGETIGIIGRNGSGKSTLLQLICGTLTPSSGEVSTNGRIAALLELGAGFNPEFSGHENIFMSASILGLDESEIKQKYDDIIKFADIGSFLQQPVKTYSSGMFARLAFSVAIHTDPDILIVDEILAVGDAAFQTKCIDKFYEIKEKGATILYVSHDEYQVRHICEKALYLRDGDQVYFGSTDAAFDIYDKDSSTKHLEDPNTAVTAGNIDNGYPKVAIESVELLNAEQVPTSAISSGDELTIRTQYSVSEPNEKQGVFVVNLYRHDSIYIFGTTTQMESNCSISLETDGQFSVTFPTIPLLRGTYHWRVAINDEKGLTILAEATPVCEFTVKDNFTEVGLVNLPRKWVMETS